MLDVGLNTYTYKNLGHHTYNMDHNGKDRRTEFSY
jgi:hypothetical protein